MAFEGTLKDFHLADIVQLIGLQRKTGVLTLEGPDDTVTIFFEEGAVVGARSRRFPLEERLRRILPLRGLVTEDQMAEVERAQAETGQRLGHVLTRLNLLSEDVLQEVVKQEVLELLYRVFQGAQGTYRFDVQARLDLPEGRVPPLPAEAFLIEAMRRMDEWPEIAGRVPDRDAVVSRGRPPGEIDRSRLGPREEQILELAHRQLPVADLVDASGLGEFETVKALASLIRSGAVRLRQAPTAEGEAARVQADGARRRAASLAWMVWAMWGLTAMWLGVNLAFFQPWDTLFASPLRGDLARQIRARSDLAVLARHLDRYYAETGAFPEQLEELVRRGMVEADMLKDPWGQPYRYNARGQAYSLSTGRDSRPAPPPPPPGGKTERRAETAAS